LLPSPLFLCSLFNILVFIGLRDCNCIGAGLWYARACRVFGIKPPKLPVLFEFILKNFQF